jgi:hypothetical protein
VGCLFKLVGLAFSGVFFLAITLIAAGAFFAFTGTPSPCVDRELNPAPGANQQLQANWLRAIDGISAGERVTLSVTEGQASSIGDGYLDNKGVPVEDLRVYFCPGGEGAQATGKVGLLGIGANVLVEGRLDVTGERPRVELDHVRAGRIPGFISRPLLDLLVDRDDVLTLSALENVSAIEYLDGEALVTIGPR